MAQIRFSVYPPLGTYVLFSLDLEATLSFGCGALDGIGVHAQTYC
jgi:hypothetical protein